MSLLNKVVVAEITVVRSTHKGISVETPWHIRQKQLNWAGIMFQSLERCRMLHATQLDSWFNNSTPCFAFFIFSFFSSLAKGPLWLYFSTFPFLLSLCLFLLLSPSSRMLFLSQRRVMGVFQALDLLIYHQRQWKRLHKGKSYTFLLTWNGCWNVKNFENQSKGTIYNKSSHLNFNEFLNNHKPHL